MFENVGLALGSYRMVKATIRLIDRLSVASIAIIAQLPKADCSLSA